MLIRSSPTPLKRVDRVRQKRQKPRTSYPAAQYVPPYQYLPPVPVRTGTAYRQYIASTTQQIAKLWGDRPAPRSLTTFGFDRQEQSAQRLGTHAAGRRLVTRESTGWLLVFS